MKKIFTLVLALCVVLTSFAACSPATNSSSTPTTASTATESESSTTVKGGSINLFTWEGMFPQEVLDAFTAETGIKVNFSAFDTDETMLSKLQTAKGGDYDVVVADDYIIETVVSENLAQKLDTSKIKNYASINPLFQGQFYDKTNEYTVPYGSGIQTIVYNPDVIKKEIKGYKDLWDESLKANIGIISNYRVINGMALKLMSESYNVTDTAKIGEAGKKLIGLAPNIRLIKDDNLQDDLISGEVNAAIMYTSQVTMAMLANPNLKVVYPEEGLGFGIMAKFIPVNAPNADGAHAFIDYILKPEVSAKCFESLGYYCTNKDADSLIQDQYKPFLTIPSNFTSDKMEMIQNITPEAEAEHTKVWTEFKTATE